MRRQVIGVFSLVAFAAAALPARPASAKAEISIFKLRDRSLSADFEDASDDGCFVTQTHILFTEAVIFQSGTPPTVQPPTVQVTIDYANACTGEFSEFSGGASPQQVQIAGDLGRASLTATVPVSGDPGSAVVTLNITWTANAPLGRVKSTTVSKDANTLTVDHIDVSARSADVAGTVAAVLPTVDGPMAFDLSRFPEGGQLGKDNDGSRTITFLPKH
jgi:hypothetical protein